MRNNLGALCRYLENGPCAGASTCTSLLLAWPGRHVNVDVMGCESLDGAFDPLTTCERGM
jgi:hypothetical protein